MLTLKAKNNPIMTPLLRSCVTLIWMFPQICPHYRVYPRYFMHSLRTFCFASPFCHSHTVMAVTLLPASCFWSASHIFWSPLVSAHRMSDGNWRFLWLTLAITAQCQRWLLVYSPRHKNVSLWKVTSGLEEGWFIEKLSLWDWVGHNIDHPENRPVV